MSIQSEWMDMKLDIIKAFRMDKTTRRSSPADV